MLACEGEHLVYDLIQGFLVSSVGNLGDVLLRLDVKLFPNWQIIHKYIMNNIIKQINYDQSQHILGKSKLVDFIGENRAFILFIADWSVPSRIICSRLKKIDSVEDRVGYIDVDLVDNIELCQNYDVRSVPHCLVLEHSKILYQFVGMNIEKLNEAISLIKEENSQKQSGQVPTECPEKHQLETLSSLPFPPYVNNYFFCNECKKIERCSEEWKVLHCEECDYDLCWNCAIEPK